MSATGPKEYRSNRAYVLARAFCQNGTVNGNRQQRLTCALVELRDHIQEDIQKLSRQWQVAANDLRRCYSYAYPASVPGAPDPLILERACEDLMRDVRYDIQNHAEQSGVPDNLLEALLVDWLLADENGGERTPTASFIPDDLVAPTTPQGDAKPEDLLPSKMHLLADRTKEGGGLLNSRGAEASGDDRSLLGPSLSAKRVDQET